MNRLEKNNFTDTFLNRFLQYNSIYQLFEKRDTILIGVSGGADSVVLLDIFNRISEQWELKIIAAHLNHQLRGPDADKDAEFVQELLKNKSIPLVLEKYDVKAWCRENNVSVETGARQVRYNFYKKTAEQHCCRRVATGHHLDDQAETILYRLMRGAGTLGLSGIRQKRGIYIRPLLFADRRSIIKYADENNISFRNDATNQDISYRRNRIRHNLIPEIQTHFNPNISQTLSNLGTIMAETEEYLNHQANIALNDCSRFQDENKIILDIKEFLLYFRALQKHIIRNAIKKVGTRTYNPDYITLGKILQLCRKQKSGRSLPIYDDISIKISRDELVIQKTEKQVKEIVVDEIPANIELWDNQILEINRNLKSLDQIIKASTSTKIWIDEERISTPLKIRTARHGDRFYPLNMKGSKKLSDFFIDEKIPNYKRDRIPVLECGNKIVWICGYRLDDRFKITLNTTKSLKLEIKG